MIVTEATEAEPADAETPRRLNVPPVMSPALVTEIVTEPEASLACTAFAAPSEAIVAEDAL